MNSDKSQEQTKDTFGFKWKLREAYESDTSKKKMYGWLLERYFGCEEERVRFLGARTGAALLDAGCGSSWTTMLLFGDYLKQIDYTGVDISEAIRTAEVRFQEQGYRGKFLQDNIQTMQLGKSYDLIYCEGVIHHASDPHQTFVNLVSHLNPGGTIMFYVYKLKAPLREFADDVIRERLKGMDNEEALSALIPLTKLGKILGDLNQEIEIEDSVDILEIPAGKYDLQRFFYWFFVKAYYDVNFTIDEMNIINFDWYRPLNCFRFKPEEIKGWLNELNLKEERFYVDEAGITAIAQKS